MTGWVFLISSYPIPVFVLVSSGILRESFLKPSVAPEELPKDVHRNPEADTKPTKAQGVRLKAVLS
jgi:hypothetical protein